MTNRLTTGQVYRMLKNFYNCNGYSPSVRELAEILGSSPGSVHRHIVILKKNGWLTGEPGKARALRFHK